MTIVTPWPVLVGFEWRTVDADLAAALATSDRFARPGAVRLGDVTVPDAIHTERILLTTREPMTALQKVMSFRRVIDALGDKWCDPIDRRFVDKCIAYFEAKTA